MDSSTAAAWAAAVVAMISAGLSIWQAALSKRQALYANRAANAAEITAVDTQRAADIAARQLAHGEVDRNKAAWLAELQALREVENGLRKHVAALLELANHLDTHPDDCPCEHCEEAITKLHEAGKLVCETPLRLVDSASGPANVAFVRQAILSVKDLLLAMGTFETRDPVQFARVIRVTAFGMSGIVRILSHRSSRMAAEKLAAELDARQAINCQS